LLHNHHQLKSLQSRSQECRGGPGGGGILGIVYGLAVVFLAQRMGAATLIATVVTGQLICSVVVDHFALVGFQPHRASPLRITGCALMIAGLTLIAKL